MRNRTVNSATWHSENELRPGSQPKWQGDLPALATSLEARFKTGFFFLRAHLDRRRDEQSLGDTFQSVSPTELAGF
jgi:hypothetical protein